MFIFFIAQSAYVFNDSDKFEKIYTQYVRLMMYKATEILHDASLAEDAVSEAFIRIYKNLHKLEDDIPSPRTASFVVTVVKNTALTILKKQDYTEILPLDENMYDEYDIEDNVLSDISADEITDMINSLGDDLKNVFIFYYEFDMSLKEIGAALGITANTAARSTRARG